MDPALRNLAVFAGYFYRAFPSADLSPIIMYLINRMSTSDFSHELEILS